MPETTTSLLSSIQAHEQSLRLQISQDESYDRSAKWQCPICSWALIRQNILKPYSRLAVTFQRYGDKNLKTHIWVHRFESMRREIIRKAIATEERCLRRRILEQQFVASTLNLFHLHFSSQFLETMRRDVFDLAMTERTKISEKAVEETKEELVEKLDVIHEKIDFSFHFEQIIRLEIEEHESRLRGLIEHETFELNWDYKFKNSPSSHIPFHVLMNSQISAENYYFKFSKFFQHDNDNNRGDMSIDRQKKQRADENEGRLKLLQRKKFLAQKWLEDNNNSFFVGGGNDDEDGLFGTNEDRNNNADEDFSDQQQKIEENRSQMNFSYCHNFVTLKQQFDKRFSQPFSKMISEDSAEERLLDFRRLPPQELILPRGILKYGVNMLMNKDLGVNNETGFIPVHRHFSENNNNADDAKKLMSNSSSLILTVNTPQEKSHEINYSRRRPAHNNNHDLLSNSANNLNASSPMIILSAVFNANSPKKGKQNANEQENNLGDLTPSKTKSVGFFDDFDHEDDNNNTGNSEQLTTNITASTTTILDREHEISKKQIQLPKFTSFGVLRRIDDDNDNGDDSDEHDDDDDGTGLAHLSDANDDGKFKRQKSSGYLLALLPQSLNVEEHEKQLADIRRREMAEFNFARAKLKKKIDRFIEAETWTRKEIDFTEKDRRERALDCFLSGSRQLMVWSGGDENNLMMKFFFDPQQRKYWDDHYFAAWSRNAKEATSIPAKRTRLNDEKNKEFQQVKQREEKENNSSTNKNEIVGSEKNSGSDDDDDDDDKHRNNKILNNEISLQKQENQNISSSPETTADEVVNNNNKNCNNNSIRASPRLRVEIVYLTSMETSQRQNIFDLEVMARSRQLMLGKNIKMPIVFLPPRQPSPKMQNRPSHYHQHHERNCCQQTHQTSNLGGNSFDDAEILIQNNQMRKMIPPSSVSEMATFQRKRSSSTNDYSNKKQDEEFIVSLYGDPFAQEIAKLQQLVEKTETKRRELVEQLKQNKEVSQIVYYQNQNKKSSHVRNRNNSTMISNWRIPTTTTNRSNNQDEGDDDDADGSVCDRSAKLLKFVESLQPNKNNNRKKPEQFHPVRPPTTTKGRPNSARI